MKKHVFFLFGGTLSLVFVLVFATTKSVGNSEVLPAGSNVSMLQSKADVPTSSNHFSETSLKYSELTVLLPKLSELKKDPNTDWHHLLGPIQKSAEFFDQIDEAAQNDNNHPALIETLTRCTFDEDNLMAIRAVCLRKLKQLPDDDHRLLKAPNFPKDVVAIERTLPQSPKK